MFTNTPSKKIKEKYYYSILGIEQDLNAEIVLSGKIIKTYPSKNCAILDHNAFPFRVYYDKELLGNTSFSINDRIKIQGVLSKIEIKDSEQSNIKFEIAINKVLEMPNYINTLGENVVNCIEKYKRKYVHLEGRVCDNLQENVFKFRDDSLSSEFIYISCADIENHIQPCYQSKIEVWGRIMGTNNDGIPLCLAARIREYDIKPEYEKKNGYWLYDEGQLPIRLIVPSSSKLRNSVGLDYLLKLQSCFEESDDTEIDEELIDCETKQEIEGQPKKYYTSHFRVYRNYKNYWNEVQDILVKADRIMKSQEYKKATDYFKTLKYRGILQETPSAENGFSLVFSDNVVQDDEPNLTNKEYEPYQLDILETCAPEFMDELLETVKRQCDILHGKNRKSEKIINALNDKLKTTDSEIACLNSKIRELEMLINDLNGNS